MLIPLSHDDPLEVLLDFLEVRGLISISVNLFGKPSKFLIIISCHMIGLDKTRKAFWSILPTHML